MSLAAFFVPGFMPYAFEFNTTRNMTNSAPPSVSPNTASSFRAELHCHTTASDGFYPPSELVHVARLRDLRVIAITDHDTIDGHAEALAAGEAHGVTVVPGIEISSLSAQGEVHVLGYGLQPADDATRQQIASLRSSRESRAKRILANLEALGKPVSFERVKELAGDAMLGRPYIATAMVEAGHVKTKQQAFDEYLAEGQPAFAPNDALTPAEAVDLIHRARGLAVMAHPALYKGDLMSVFGDMLAHGLDGIEVYYPLHTPEQSQTYAALARQHNLLVTGGSDFHSPLRDTELALGSIRLPEGAVDALLHRIQTTHAKAAPPA